MDILQTLLYSVPMMIVAISVTVYFAMRTYRLSRVVERYEQDKFRLDLERQIALLSQQMTESNERFKQVNHLLISGQTARPEPFDSSREHTPRFLREMGVDTDVPVDPNLVFVLTPFNPEGEETYRVIASAVEELGLRCRRGDEERMSSNILPHILEMMLRSRVIIANITGRNPNVFYELGIAHALSKPVLLVAESAADIPFDIATIRVLIYHNLGELRKNLRRWLVQAVARAG